MLFSDNYVNLSWLSDESAGNRFFKGGIQFNYYVIIKLQTFWTIVRIRFILVTPHPLALPRTFRTLYQLYLAATNIAVTNLIAYRNIYSRESIFYLKRNSTICFNYGNDDLKKFKGRRERMEVLISFRLKVFLSN